MVTALPQYRGHVTPTAGLSSSPSSPQKSIGLHVCTATLCLMTWIVSDDIVSYMDSRFSKQNFSSKEGANPTFRELGSAMFHDT